MSTRQLHVRVRAVHGRVDGRCAAAYRPCTRPCNVSCARYTAAARHVTRRPCTRPVNTSSPTKTARTRPYNGGVWAVPVYTTRVHDCVREVCTDVFGRVHGTYTAPYTGRVHRHVLAVHTTRIRPRTRVHVYKGRLHGRARAIYTAENGRLHGRTRPCNTAV